MRKSAGRSREEEEMWGGTIPSGDPLRVLLSVEVGFLRYREEKNFLRPAWDSVVNFTDDVKSRGFPS